MRIAVLAHGLVAGGGVSVGVNIIRALQIVRPNYNFLFVVPDYQAYKDIILSAHADFFVFRHNYGVIGRGYFDIVMLKRLLNDFNPCVVFSLGNFGLSQPTTFCQAILFHKPQFVYPEVDCYGENTKGRMLNKIRKWRVKKSLSERTLMFFQTTTMRDRFVKHFRFHGKTALLPNAVSKTVVNNLFVSNVPEIFSVTFGCMTLLVLTRYYPHKNLEILVDTFDFFREQLSDVCCILTINENQHPGARSLLKKIDKLNLTKQFINVGSIDQRELANYYNNVDAMLLPTLIESFSSTYIEAMMFGCPILTSDRDFSREVCQDAALYFDPQNSESLRDSIIRLRDDDFLQKKLVAAGKNRIQQMQSSWEQILDGAMSEIEDFVTAE